MSTYVFDCGELLGALDRINNDNSQAEYYVTDCPGILRGEVRPGTEPRRGPPSGEPLGLLLLLAVLLSAGAAQAEYLGNVTFDRPSPSFLPHGVQVTVTIDFDNLSDPIVVADGVERGNFFRCQDLPVGRSVCL